jgi:uncharacterized damage-inducible protein DinB
MSISDTLLAELLHEQPSTRRHLERVPPGQPDWKPHPKSMTLSRLSSHVAEIPTWAGSTVRETELDLAPPEAKPPGTKAHGSASELVRAFDANMADALSAVRSASDAHWMMPWSLKYGGKVVFTLPRIVVMRNFVLNHLIHHRAQLGLYLRMLGVAVPATYGPTADEAAM